METMSTNSSSSEKQRYEPIIVIPGQTSKNRIPGYYPDILTKEKARNNNYILHACKLLKSYQNNKGINALVLDGKQMRTTHTLQKLGDKLKKIIIVEYSNETYEYMLNKKRTNVYCYNCHIKEYIDNLNDPRTNVVYFDTMGSFFTSKKSYGADIIINEFLRQSICDEIILAATFCLRNPSSQLYEIQQNKILLLLDKIFIINGFSYKSLVPKNNLRYKGQKAFGKSMIFVLFYLRREQ